MKTVAAFAAEYVAAPSSPSLEEYTHFHGMLCKPSTAARCVESFNGTVLFMPHDYYDPTMTKRESSSLQPFDCTRPILSVVSYYLLVWMSLTGLSTLLRQTKFLVSRDYASATNTNLPLVFQRRRRPAVEGTQPTKEEERDGNMDSPWVADSDKELIVYPHVWEYVLDRSVLGDATTKEVSGELRLKRQFEYNFGGVLLGGGLSVVMLHLQCNQNKLHLVEVYQWKNPILRAIFRSFSRLSGLLLRSFHDRNPNDSSTKKA